MININTFQEIHFEEEEGEEEEEEEVKYEWPEEWITEDPEALRPGCAGPPTIRCPVGYVYRLQGRTERDCMIRGCIKGCMDDAWMMEKFYCHPPTAPVAIGQDEYGCTLYDCTAPPSIPPEIDLNPNNIDINRVLEAFGEPPITKKVGRVFLRSPSLI